MVIKVLIEDNCQVKHVINQVLWISFVFLLNQNCLFKILRSLFEVLQLLLALSYSQVQLTVSNREWSALGVGKDCLLIVLHQLIALSLVEYGIEKLRLCLILVSSIAFPVDFNQLIVKFEGPLKLALLLIAFDEQMNDLCFLPIRLLL